MTDAGTLEYSWVVPPPPPCPPDCFPEWQPRRKAWRLVRGNGPHYAASRGGRTAAHQNGKVGGFD